MQVDISIIIPTSNRNEKFKLCIQSVLSQNYLKEKIEIIVIDDRSDTILESTIKDMAKLHPNLIYASQYRKGPAIARNLGAKLARGKIIGFVDDDCVLDGDWVKLMLQAHAAHPQIVAIGGDTLTSTNNPSVLASQFLSTGSIEINLDGKKEAVFFPTCNVSIKKELFIKYNFNEYFPFPGGEDLELFWRIFKDGHHFLWDRNIKVIHYRDNSLNSFLKQAYYYGRGNFLVQYIHQDHPLLKELKVGKVNFWLATMINTVKIPRFSYLLGSRLIDEYQVKQLWLKIKIFIYFVLHKVFYISGNITEYFRIKKLKGAVS